MKRTKLQKKQITQLLSEEKGTLYKPFGIGKSIALVYPNSYYVGMSNLGFQTVYRILNEKDDVVCERSFLDFNKPITMENQRHLSDFDIIAFSVSYELDYYNILEILNRAKIPLHRKKRNANYPIIIAGGTAIGMNHRPLMDFIDLFFLGESEEFINHLSSHLNSFNSKEDFLDFFSSSKGVFIPDYSNNKPEEFVEVNLNDYPTYSQIVTPNTEFSNMFLIEISRGCPYKCKFCYTGYCYSNFRIRDSAIIKSQIDKAVPITNKIGLVGSAICSHPDINDICKYAIENNLSISFSSLRIEELRPSIIDIIQQSKQRTLTIAPEAGSKRLRKFIGKSVSNNKILNSIEKIFKSGIQNLKLYFMIGLPSEDHDDIEAIIHLVNEIRKLMLKIGKHKGKLGKLIINIGIFVPRSKTPFANEKVENLKNLSEKIKHLNNNLKKLSNIQVRISSPYYAKVQELTGIGDKDIGDVFLKVLNENGNWRKVVKFS